ncbi:hypothetical protein LCGC14_2894970, partial [marine sediment metagenome]
MSLHCPRLFSSHHFAHSVASSLLLFRLLFRFLACI